MLDDRLKQPSNFKEDGKRYRPVVVPRYSHSLGNHLIDNAGYNPTFSQIVYLGHGISQQLDFFVVWEEIK